MDGTAKTPFKFPNWIVLLLWILGTWLILGVFFRPSGQPGTEVMSYTELKSEVAKDNVSEITMKGEEITGTFKKPIEKSGKIAPEAKKQEADTYNRFRTIIPPVADPELMGLLEKHNVTITAQSAGTSWGTTVLVSLLPWVLIIGFFIYSNKRMGGGLGGKGGIFGFGKSKAKVYQKTTSSTAFEDVAGLDNAKKELEEIVEYLKAPDKFKSLGGKLPRGVLLIGPPGTGKTLLARAVAGEAGVPFYSISGSEFIEMFVGVGASRVRDLFENAKKSAPSIIFIDELDSIGRLRGTGMGGGNDEREQTLNQILSEMDGFDPHVSVIVLAATNRPDVLDPALIRPGRFDRQVTVDLPQRKARKAILQIHARNVPLADDVDLEAMARRTPGFSGADLENLINEAALLAAREGKDKVEAKDFEQGVDKVYLGIEREDLLSEEDRKIVAYHEAGHALLAKFMPNADPLDKVTIIPHSRALGATEQIPSEDRYNVKRSYLLTRVGIMLGGRVAEQIVYGDFTTGAADDLKKATQLARKMVCDWGMSEKLGSVTFQQSEQHPFLGRELAEPRNFSEHTARLIDEEIQGIVGEMRKKAHEILESHRVDLDALADALLEHESLSDEDVDQVLKGHAKVQLADAG